MGAAEYRGATLALEPGALDARDIGAAQTAFGIDLLHTMCAQDPGTNLLISPTSAAEAVGMLQPAGDSATEARLAEVLHLPTWSPELIAALNAHTAALARLAGPQDPDVEADRVRMSNRLWNQHGTQPEQAYLDDVATAFDAGMVGLDFAGDPVGSTDHINRVIGEDTAGLIPSLFDDPLSRDTLMVLTNAIHLRATWATEFTTAMPAPFASPGGEVSVDMMTEGSGTLRTARGWTSIEIPYTDGTLTAVALLPPEEDDPCSVTAADVDALAAGTGSTADVSMPRLELAQSHDLLAPLVELGLPGAGFPGLGGGDGIIDQIPQKTVLIADEQGTEAAAATGVVVVLSAGPPPVVLDRPFVLLIRDTETGSPLFRGVINDPTQP